LLTNRQTNKQTHTNERPTYAGGYAGVGNKSNKIHYNIKLTKKLKPGLVNCYDLWPGNGTDLFWKE